MLIKACNDTCVFKANPVFRTAATKRARIAVAAAIMIIAIGCHLWGQNQRSYIYLDGQLVSSESQTLPVSWGSAEVGATGISGSSSYSGSTYTVAGSGANITGSADAFRFAYQRISGDLTITARVVSLTNPNNWAKVGVMIRNGLDANAANALTAIRPNNTTTFSRRIIAGGESTTTAGPTGQVPYWVRLRRSGNTFMSYVSTNGTSWTLVGSQSISMPVTVYVGLAVTANNNAALCTATFDNVSINALPYPWESSDIGSVGISGSSSYSGTTLTVAASGSDVWGTADSFRYVYVQVTGDVVITARVVSLTKTNGYAKAGVMIRDGLAANASNAFTLATPSNVLAFQRRSTAGGDTSITWSSPHSVPYWVRLQRVGNYFQSYISTDGTIWIYVGSQSITMSATVYVGLAVTAHNNAAICTASFDNVTIQAPNPVPTVTSINPDAVPSGNPGFVLNIYGSGFIPSSWVIWNGNFSRTTTYISESHLQANITAADVAVAGNYSVAVSNPEPGGGRGYMYFKVHGQPTCLSFSPIEGFAGVSNITITACNAPDMSIDIEYEFTPWGGGAAQTLTKNMGTTNASGILTWSIPQNAAPGTMVVRKIKNALRLDWYTLSPPYPTLTIRPAKPITFQLTPTTLYLPGQLSIYSNNSQNQTIVEEYLNPNPPGGILQVPLPMNSSGQWSWPYACGIEPTGTYTFKRIRNQLDSGLDAWQSLPDLPLTLVPCP
ncbi:MAG: hypothetical protein QUT30_07570 [Acidobacteriota bacterium]|nr:hypothetical protein [Acidobacteriota bacterium]